MYLNISIHCRWEVPSWSKDAQAAQHGGGSVIAPMHGKVVKVAVNEGDRVTKGQALVVMEAMKMEHTVTSPQDGIVQQLKAFVGAQIDDGKLLLSIDTAGE